MIASKTLSSDQDPYWIHPAHLLCPSTIMLWLLSLFMCIFRGLLLLHNACSYGHFEVLELQLKYNANVNAVDLWKFTPIHKAAAKGKYRICKLLLKVLCLILTVHRIFACSRSVSVGHE